jgi:acetolactate synthase-1/2/3 large subunit
MEASQPENCAAIRNLIRECPLPVASTYQGAGVVARELEHLFAGRVGLFKNQIADKMLDQADVIIAIGFSAVEYDSGIWNKQPKKRKIIHIDCAPADLHLTYNPSIELIGDIAKTVESMKEFRRLPQGIRGNHQLRSLEKQDADASVAIHPRLKVFA